MLAAGLAVTSPLTGFGLGNRLRVVLVGTGVRGINFWGKRLIDQYASKITFVGLCDVNPGRVAYAKRFMGVDCPVFTNFDQMMSTVKADLVIVCTTDSAHHEIIIKGFKYGCDVLTEKPLTIDEEKCQQIIDAEKQTTRNLIVGFNYRWGPYVTRVKELLHQGTIGEVTSVDFNWYLNVHHGASYFRRWHGLMEQGGSLWVHKATHHFDLLNWWLDSEPEEIFAYGALEHYGKNGPFRGENCRRCDHKKECNYYWDITKNTNDIKLYVDNEHHDGYYRDNCVYREDINIYDKMSAQIKFKSKAIVNYSLTTYSPFEGWRIAFNGHKGRIEAWQDIPWMNNETLDQAQLHDKEMAQSAENDKKMETVILFKSWEDYKVENLWTERSGHGGGDRRLQDKLFLNPNSPDPLKHQAGIRDGVMSVITGIGARRSIEQGKPIRIEDLIRI